MPSSWGASEVCPECGLRYPRMRTGLTFADVVEMFWQPSDDPARWKNKRRRTILGKWHQIKLELWDYHLECCDGES